MKTSELLIRAKKHLSDGISYKTPYICFAIGRTVAAARHKDALRKLIMRRLEGEGSLEFWLLSKGVSRREFTRERVQAHRHAWVDMLIAEFQAKGD